MSTENTTSKKLFTSLFSSEKINVSDGTENMDENESNKSYMCVLPNLFQQKQVTNYTPPTNRGNNVSKETWERYYLTHLLNMYDIFQSHIKKLNPYLYFELQYRDFFDNFSWFIRDCSSGYISPYLEQIDPKLEELYIEYLSDKNDI